MPGETIKRVAFAARLNVNRSTVTRWAEAGRLVLDAAGDVLVEESLARLRETSAGRDDVADRHATNRGAAIPEAMPAAENATEAENRATARATSPATDLPRGVESRADAQARKEAAAADLLEIELAQKRGTMIPKEDVDAALKAFAAAARARLDVLADQLAPVVAPVTDMAETHALLAEHGRQVLAGIADDLQRAEAALGHA